MRKEFVECKRRKTAWNKCPWASLIVRVCGGYYAFESLTDYHVWKNER